MAADTPLVPLHSHDDRRDIWLKPEIHQPVTSFKIRGIFNAVSRLPPERRAQGLSTVSAGNTAQALAWCGRHFGVPARSVMPEGAPMDWFVGKVPAQGNTVRVPKGGTEWAVNVGEKRYHEVLIELKKS